MPLTVTEFAPAALTYPVIFVGDARQPVAVMGLRQGENLFVSETGAFKPEAYIPAMAFRHPMAVETEAQERFVQMYWRERVSGSARVSP